MRALLAEDDPETREVLEDALREHGWEVTAVVDAATAWARFREAHVPLVILSASRGGVEVCRSIRSLPAVPHTYVLFVADPTPGALRTMIDAGGDDFLVRPVSRLTLHPRLALAERRLRVPSTAPGTGPSERQILELRETLGVQTAFLEELFESAPEGIAIVDASDRIVRVNAEFCRMFGYTQPEVLGRAINELIAPVDRAAEALGVTLQVLQGERVSLETVRRRKDGSELHVSLLARPVRVRGEQAGTYAIYRDITERVRAAEALRQREQEFRALVENAPDVIVRFDREQRILYVNPAVERATGLPPLSFIGNQPRALRMPDSVTATWGRALQEVFATAQNREIDFGYPGPNGERRFQACIVPELVAGGTVETVLSIVHDVTEREQAEAALRESEEQYRRFFEEDLSGDFVATPRGDLLLCNPAFARIFGLESVEEVLSQSGDASPLRGEILVRLTELLRRDRRVEGYEMELTRGDGTPVQVVGNVSGTFDERGELIEFHGYLLDVTEQKRAETALRESEARYRALFDQSPVGVFLCDRDFRVTRCNQRLVEILGVPCEEIIGTDLVQLPDPRVQPVIQHALESDRVSYEARYEGPYRSRPGAPDIWVSARISPLRDSDGDPVGGIGVVEDVTEREQAEAQLRAQAEELELINAELRQRSEEVEAAMQARSRLYARMSHELRTPISAIMLYNELLLGGSLGPLTGEQSAGVQRALDAAQHLLELVHDILDLSKIEAGKVVVHPEPVHLPDLLDDLFATILPLAHSRGSELRVEQWDEACAVVTDPRRLRQILLNLFSNAVKFGRSRPIAVRCRSTLAGEVAIEVADQGVGIAPEDLPRIFDDFVQVGDAQESGTGLGLAISQRLTELLGGRLEVESTPGVGSTFRVVLPRATLLPAVPILSDLPDNP